MTRHDCQSNIEDARLFSEAEHPLIITDFNLHPAGFFVLSNECSSPDIDILFVRDTLNILSGIKGKTYSDIFITHASDSLVQNLKRQFGEEMVPLKDEIAMFASQLWRIDGDSLVIKKE